MVFLMVFALILLLTRGWSLSLLESLFVEVRVETVCFAHMSACCFPSEVDERFLGLEGL